jgi:hypothetical protein
MQWKIGTPCLGGSLKIGWTHIEILQFSFNPVYRKYKESAHVMLQSYKPTRFGNFPILGSIGVQGV